ncbi:MAG TPA: ABC transporter permease [Gemmatimonadales bacterium]|nr:ABC transporter permease [Gemmatimonadales bacterium]
MDALWQDLRYAFRALRKSPGFTLAAVVTLALGIGGNTAIYSLVNTLLLEPLPFEGGERLVMFWEENDREGRSYSEVAPAQVRALQQRATAFEDIAPYDLFGFTLTGSGEPEQLTGTVVAHNFFGLLGVTPLAGRLFTPEDDRQGAPPVAVLSHEFWRRRFAGDPSTVGRSLLLSGVPTTVVGVLPEGFRFEAPADVYHPLAQPESLWENRRARILRVVGKLAPGTALARARAEVQAISRSLEAEYPETNAGWEISVVPAVEGLFQGPVRPTLIAFLGAVGFVLLIACADVANLLLARATGRRRELAVRAALGAGRRRLVKQLLSESLLLAGFGAAAGLLLAVWALSVLESVFPAAILRATPRLTRLEIDGSVLAFTGLVTIVTGLVFGLLPALRATRASLSEELAEEGRSTADRGRGRLRAALVGAQVALALVLCTGAGLMIRSFVNQVLANPGFRPDNVLTFWTALPQTRYPDGPSIAAFQLRALETLRALPGVEGVAGANVVPLSGEGARTDFTILGGDAGAAENLPTTQYRLVSPDYFQVLGVPLVSGRVFDQRDRVGGAPVAAINQALADRYFPGRSPLGERIVLAGDSVAREVVGVVGNVADWRQSDRVGALLYLPFQQRRSARMGFLVRTAVAPAGLADAARRAVAELDPDQPIYDVQPLRELVNFSLFTQRLSAGMLGVLALVAVALAAVGVYGVMAYNVGQRTREIGLRMALGARAAEVLGLMLRHGMTPVLAGLLAGAAGALVLTRVLRRMLFEVSPTDPVTFGLTGGLLALVAAAAIYLPSRRAARVDPAEVLRQ